MLLGLYISGGILVLLALIAVIGFVVHKNMAEKIFKRQVWHKLYSLAQDQDYYLLNNVTLNTETQTIHIDHLLVGNKFVYAIGSRYYEDNIEGESYSADRWHVVDKNGSPRREITNPVYFNETRTLMLAKFLGWNDTKSPMFISIVVINNSTDVHLVDERINEYSYLIHKKDVAKLIKKIEKEADLLPFDDQSLMKIISRVHRLSLDAQSDEERKKKASLS